jgi:glycine betaine/proline transport system substrate-binding protein
MDQMLAQLNEPGATAETVADRFVAERADLWQAWVGATP